jgi:hypothetical protein
VLEKISRANLGKVILDSVKEAQAKRMTGEGNYMYGKSRPEVSSNNVATKGHKISYQGVVYPSARKMAFELRISRKSITALISSGLATKLNKEPT